MEKEKDVLRTDECVKRYKERNLQKGVNAKEVDLLMLPFISEWNYWQLVENEFPYDRIAEVHSMLVPKRKFASDKDMNAEEREELFFLKDAFSAEKMFDIVFENLPHDRSVPGQYHLHCLKLRYRIPLSDVWGDLSDKKE